MFLHAVMNGTNNLLVRNLLSIDKSLKGKEEYIRKLPGDLMKSKDALNNKHQTTGRSDMQSGLWKK